MDYINLSDDERKMVKGGGQVSAGAPQQQNGGTAPQPSDSQVGSASQISTTVPDEYTATSYEELIPQLEKRMSEYKPLSEEELKKLRRRQKAQGIISGISDAVQSVANLWFTHNYAPDMYNAKEGMSAKAKARFDKEKAERDADAEKYLNYALTIGKMKDADKEKGLKAWQAEQTLARQDRAYDDAKAFRDKDYDERIRQWQANFDRQGEWHKEEGDRWNMQFKESLRQFNINSANERARINMEGQRLAQQLQQGQMTFNLGSGHGNVTLTLDKLNAQTVSRIYHTLPADVREKVKGDPIYKPQVKDGQIQYGIDGKPLQEFVGYKDPTTEAMLIAIGANVEGSPATQSAIKQVAGIEIGKKPKAY